MKTSSFGTVFKNLAANKRSRDYPGRDDLRCQSDRLWPAGQPSFAIDAASRPAIFTIGSCFARNIEEALAPLGFVLPTRQLVAPPEERGLQRSNSMLNEFNPGTMQQRILYALAGREFDTETIVPSSGGLFADLLLFGGPDVSWDRAAARRQEIAQVYASLQTSQYVIITLGLVEAWCDEQTGLYLNRMPPIGFMKANPDRYSLRQLDAADCLQLLEPALAAIVERGIKIVLTVSPVPLSTTMTTADAVIANEVSKAALRVCADQLCQRFQHVDYFPSYEIVRSGGLASYEDDNVHVKSAIVHTITNFMITAYCGSPDLARSA